MPNNNQMDFECYNKVNKNSELLLVYFILLIFSNQNISLNLSYSILYPQAEYEYTAPPNILMFKQDNLMRTAANKIKRMMRFISKIASIVHTNENSSFFYILSPTGRRLG